MNTLAWIGVGASGYLAAITFALCLARARDMTPPSPPQATDGLPTARPIGVSPLRRAPGQDSARRVRLSPDEATPRDRHPEAP